MSTAGRELREASVEASGVLVSWMEGGCPSEPFGVDGVVRAILDKVPQGLVDSGLQLLVFDAHSYSVVLGGERKTVHLEHTNDTELRGGLRIVSADGIVVHHSIDLAILEVQGSKLDVGIGVDLHPGDQFGIDLACRADLNADRLSHKILRFGDSALGRVVHDTHVRPVVGNGEEDLLLAVGDDPHGGAYRIELLSLQSKEKPVKSPTSQIAGLAHLYCDGFHQFDVKPCGLVVRIDVLERRIRRIRPPVKYPGLSLAPLSLIHI